MKLDEILNSPYEYQPIRFYDEGNAVARFNVDPDGDESGDIEVGFHEITPGSYDIVFDRDGEFKLTGQGDAIRILATVAAIVKDFVSTTKPDAISFSAKKNEPSRVAVYRRLAKKVVASGYEEATPPIEIQRWYPSSDALFYFTK